MMFRFTLSHSVLGDQVISEPDGWEGAILKLERDMDLFSLIETFNGGANDAFIFYGDNGTENGGIDFIRQVESTYGFDADITMLIEYAEDDVNYVTLFSGLLDLSAKNEMKDNKMQVPVIRDDFWSKFMNRFETPVNISDTVDLDGNAVDAVDPITVNLTSQKLRSQYEATSSTPGITDEDVNVIVSGTYYPMSWDVAELDEIEEVYTLPQIDNSEIPVPVMELEYGGEYSFNFQTVAYDYAPGAGGYNFGVGEDLSDYIRFYININGVETEFTVGDKFDSDNTDGGRFYSLNLTNQILPAGSLIQVYGKAIANLTATPSFSGQIRWNGPIVGNISINDGALEDVSIDASAQVTADTIYPPTEAEGYLIHDLIYGVLARIGLGADPFYSEFFGSTLTQTRQYDDDGCGWMYAVVKGLQLRQYALTEKPFFISFKDIWEGINPILNIGLGYEQVDGSQVIRIEQKNHFVPPGQTPPVLFSNVRDISCEYDKDFIFKTIRTGYKQGKPEDVSGIDDPYKQVRATIIQKSGTDINLESSFIASGLSIEITRRNKKEKSKDYKFDDNNFIISLNTNDVSPDVYAPELDENFASVTGIISGDTRYNLMLTPMRNFLRWRRYFDGCLQSYLDSKYKFVSGEGNYNIETQASIDLCSRAVSTSALSENDDISPSSLNLFYFLPLLFTIHIDMSKEEYDMIDRKLPIGISQSASSHINFVIKSLEFNLLKGEATIRAWPEGTFNITVPEQVIPDPPCLEEEVIVTYDAGYQAILDYSDTIC